MLFLDEPTIGLDVTMQKRIRTFVADYNRAARRDGAADQPLHGGRGGAVQSASSSSTTAASCSMVPCPALTAAIQRDQDDRS